MQCEIWNVFRHVQSNVTIASNYWICWQFNCKHFLIVNKVDIIWFNPKTAEFFSLTLNKFFMKLFCLRIFVSVFCSSGLLYFFTRVTSKQCSRAKIMWDSSCSGNTQKTNFSLGYIRESFTWKVQKEQSSKSQLFKVANKWKPPCMFSLPCNFLKMGAYSNDLEKIFLAKNPCNCNQIRSSQITANVNALNHFHF